MDGKMMNVDAREALIAAGLPAAQAETIALLVPDWAQFEARLEAKLETVATKDELREMESRLNQRMLTFVLVPVAFVVVAFMVSYMLNTFVA